MTEDIGLKDKQEETFSFSLDDIKRVIGEGFLSWLSEETPDIFSLYGDLKKMPEQEKKKIEEQINKEFSGFNIEGDELVILLTFFAMRSPSVMAKLKKEVEEINFTELQKLKPKVVEKLKTFFLEITSRLRLLAVPTIVKIPELPRNSFFVNIQKINQNGAEVDKGRHKTKIEWTGYIPQTAKEKALYASIYLGLASYCIDNKNDKEVRQIKLTDLMRNIGYPSWGKEKGYRAEQKEEVLEMVWKVAQTRTKISYSGEGIPPIIRDLFPDIKRSDNYFYEVQAFEIETTGIKDKNGKLKDAVIRFKPRFKLDETYTYKEKVLGLSLKEPEFKNLAIFLTYGKQLSKQATIQIGDLLEIIKLTINSEHPKKTYEQLKRLLKKAKDEGLLMDYALPKPDGKHGWLNRWLEEDLKITYER